MHCAGFASDTYDRYVLGLLEEPDRSNLETQIQEQCPACLNGVQRSMNLWLVFAETLENAEPSEDFRGRIVRIAELSRKVLTFPKDSAVRERTAVPISTLLVICGVTSVLLVATWYAGRASSRMDAPPAPVSLEKVSLDVANDVKEVAAQKPKHPDPTVPAPVAHPKLEDEVAKAQADAARYKSQIDRDEKKVVETNSLLAALARSGARLLPMKASEAAGKALGYAVFAENSRLVFVGSNLPQPSLNHTFQLWILRKDEPTEVSAGVFTPSDKDTSVVNYENASLLSNVTGVLVTEEPVAGDYSKPSGPRLFEASTAIDN
jgi:anti-sigma-K factor RskA